jgi:hypothetical protein
MARPRTSDSWLKRELKCHQGLRTLHGSLAGSLFLLPSLRSGGRLRRRRGYRNRYRLAGRAEQWVDFKEVPMKKEDVMTQL